MILCLIITHLCLDLGWLLLGTEDPYLRISSDGIIVLLLCWACMINTWWCNQYWYISIRGMYTRDIPDFLLIDMKQLYICLTSIYRVCACVHHVAFQPSFVLWLYPYLLLNLFCYHRPSSQRLVRHVFPFLYDVCVEGNLITFLLRTTINSSFQFK